MTGNETKKKEKKKVLIDDLYNRECSRFSFFVVNTAFIALVMSCLFLLFLKIEIYPFIRDKHIIPEIIGVIGNIIAIAAVIAAFGLPSAVLAQALSCGVAAYAVNLVLVNYFNCTYFGPIIAVAVMGLLFYASIKYEKRFYTYGIALFTVLCLIVAFSIDNDIPPQIYKKDSSAVVKKDGADAVKRNVIFLVLSNHIGYDFGMENASALDEYRQKNDQKQKSDRSDWKETFRKIIGGFYVSNGFSFFPHAFNYEGSNNDLLAATLNFNENYTKNSGILTPDYSRIMYNNSPERLAIGKNTLFADFHKNGYKINVYQSKGANLCADNVLNDIDSCYTYSNTGEIYKSSLKSEDKSLLLIDMWLSSYFKSVSVSNFLKNILFISGPDDYPVVINEQFSVLEKLESDILKAKGKNVFFAYLRMPYRPFVYNSNCGYLDLPEWRYNEYNSGNVKYAKYDYYQKYFGQLFCTYGKLEKMMEQLRKNNVLDYSMVIVFGDQGAGMHDYKYEYGKSQDDKYSKAVNLLDNMKNKYSTIAAYYDPNMKNFTNHNEGCDILTILKRNLWKNTEAYCKNAPLAAGDEATEMANSLYTDWETEIKASFDDITLIRDFKEWFQVWSENQSKK